MRKISTAAPNVGMKMYAVAMMNGMNATQNAAKKQAQNALTGNVKETIYQHSLPKYPGFWWWLYIRQMTRNARI